MTNQAEGVECAQREGTKLMPKARRRKTSEAAEDAADLRWLRELRKETRESRPLEQVFAEIEACKRVTPIRRRRGAHR